MAPEELTDRWHAGQDMLARAATVAGWRVRLMRPPDGVAPDNLMLLYAARSPQRLAVDDAVALARHFAVARTIHSGVRAAGLPTFAGVDLAYHLIWTRQLHTDMTRPLTPSSTAWLQEER